MGNTSTAAILNFLKIKLKFYLFKVFLELFFLFPDILHSMLLCLVCREAMVFMLYTPMLSFLSLVFIWLLLLEFTTKMDI